ncbi:D-alanyl-D-alanine carboxypeptidase family protein, partial [Vibrio parahaemolyticus V-223/04]
MHGRKTSQILQKCSLK